MKKTTATKATGKGKGALKASKVFKPSIMAKNVLDTLVQNSIDADIAHTQVYNHVSETLRDGIPSGLKSDLAFAEYQRRLKYYAGKLAKARGVEPDSITRAVSRYQAAANWTSPKREKSEDEVAQAERSKDAKRKELEREIAKVKKSQPSISAELALEKAKETVSEKREAETAAGKQRAAREAVQQGKRGINVVNFPQEVKEGKYGDSDGKECLHALAAFLILFNDLGN